MGRGSPLTKGVEFRETLIVFSHCHIQLKPQVLWPALRGVGMELGHGGGGDLDTQENSSLALGGGSTRVRGS